MSKIFLQPPDHRSFDQFLACAKRGGHNLEIACFADPDVLDGNWQEVLEDHRRKLRHFEGTISLHGPFLGLYIHSRDGKIRSVARDRILQSLEIGKTLGAKHTVFHGNFIPLIRQESYRRNWVAQNAAFWSEVLRRYDITVLLENVWEPTPDLFRQVLDGVGSPRFKVCFDVAHANIFSRVPLDDWFALLEGDIVYMHVSENKGDADDELVPGDGNIDWQRLSDVIRTRNISPDIVFEVGTVEKTKDSLLYFQNRNIYPFDKG
jgi:sugar phosphate isomerase/epimerase